MFRGDFGEVAIRNSLSMFPSRNDAKRTTEKYIPKTGNTETAKRQTNKLREEAAAREKKKADFEKNCFSSWNGSCRELVSYVKERMNNPKSFEHVETKYYTSNDYAVVIMTYRGTNAFGAVVTGNIKAKVSFDCEVLEIMN
jgi:hypothetical protein